MAEDVYEVLPYLNMTNVVRPADVTKNIDATGVKNNFLALAAMTAMPDGVVCTRHMSTELTALTGILIIEHFTGISGTADIMLSHTPKNATGILFLFNGNPQIYNNAFSLAGAVITCAQELVADDHCFFMYQY